MKFGVGPAGPGRLGEPEVAAGFAQLAEEVGFESLWTAEHLVVPTGYGPSHPYSADGTMHWPDDIAWSESLVWLAFAAAHTSRITLATGVVVLPQRNPIVFAKQTATLDVLSGGRLLLGVGTGWLREEGEAVGIDWHRRGRMTDEHIAAVRALWSTPEQSFAGDFVEFTAANCFPKPVRPSGVPIVVAGHSDAAARRAGRLGDGFFPIADETRLAHLLDVMRSAASEAGRDAQQIEVTVHAPPARDADDAGGGVDLATMRRLADLGVSRFVYDLPVGPGALATSVTVDELAEPMRRFADGVVDRWR